MMKNDIIVKIVFIHCLLQNTITNVNLVYFMRTGVDIPCGNVQSDLVTTVTLLNACLGKTMSGSCLCSLYKFEF